MKGLYDMKLGDLKISAQKKQEIAVQHMQVQEAQEGKQRNNFVQIQPEHIFVVYDTIMKSKEVLGKQACFKTYLILIDNMSQTHEVGINAQIISEMLGVDKGVIYNALKFLREQGFIHQVASETTIKKRLKINKMCVDSKSDKIINIMSSQLTKNSRIEIVSDALYIVPPRHIWKYKSFTKILVLVGKVIAGTATEKEAEEYGNLAQFMMENPTYTKKINDLTYKAAAQRDFMRQMDAA